MGAPYDIVNTEIVITSQFSATRLPPGPRGLRYRCFAVEWGLPLQP